MGCPDPGGAADGADGRRDRCAGTVRRQARRPRASAADRRVRLLHGGDRADLAVDRDDADDADLAAGAAVHRHGRRHGVHLVTAGRHRHPQPAAAAGGRGLGRLQHHPSGRQRAGQRGHGGLHDVADQRRDARWRSATCSRGIGRPSCPRSCTSRSRPRCRSHCCCRRSSRCSASSPRCSCAASATAPTGAGRLRRRVAGRVHRKPCTPSRRRLRLLPRRRRIRRVHGRLGRAVSAEPRRSRSGPPPPRCSRATRATPRFCASTSSTRCTRLPRPGTAVPSRPGTACWTTSVRRSGRGRAAARAVRRADRGGRPRRHGRRPFNGDRPWRSILDDLLADVPAPPTWAPEPIGFAHNGFHVEHEQHFQVPPPVAEPSSRGRHARGADDDDAEPTAGTRCGSATSRTAPRG